MVKKLLAAQAAFALAGCMGPIASCPPPPDRVTIQKELVPVTVPCVDPKDIPAVPPLVGDEASGDARHDLLLAAPSATDLRVALVQAVTLLNGCAAKPKGSG